MSRVLISVAIAAAIIEWLTSAPKPDEPAWPRWAKLFCAAVVAFVGVWGLLDGYFARNAGIEAYKDRKLLTAIEKLNIAHASAFNDRSVIDHLGLAHKGIADQAVDGPVAFASYNKALEFFVESRTQYPESPFAKNAMINIYRRLKKWGDLTPLARSFESELRANSFRHDGKPVSDNLRATFLVTLGSVFADQDNPNRSDAHAVTLYRLAHSLDSSNSFVVLNMPPRLIDLARKMDLDSKDRFTMLAEALALSAKGLKLPEPRDQVFSVLSIIQILMMEKSPPVPIPGFDLAAALKVVESNQDARSDFDTDTWFVLTEAHIANRQLGKAKTAFNQALVHQGRFTKAQHKWADTLWKKVVSTGDYPFQQLVDAN